MKLSDKIEGMLNYDEMEEFFNCDFSYFEKFGKVTTVKGCKHIFIDNKAGVLGVAHLDVVNELNHFYPLNIHNGKIVMSSRCDDRLGVYILLKILPAMGIKVDVLLTDNEEIGQSTAVDFVSKKKYNWIFQFDRRGDDVVTYKYNNKKWLNALTDSGFKIGVGSFSDICELENLGCSGVNVGCGYFSEHSDLCFFDVYLMIKQVSIFISFYNDNKNVFFPHEKNVISEKILYKNWYDTIDKEYFNDEEIARGARYY
jgi:hypothetical protein